VGDAASVGVFGDHIHLTDAPIKAFEYRFDFAVAMACGRITVSSPRFITQPGVVMSTVETSRPQRFVLYGEPWESYIRLLRIFDERRHLRITYDRGALEIMTLSPEHEQWKRLIGRLIVALTEELELPLAEYGSMTIKRRKKLRGLEPDECFWIQNAARMRNIKKYDIRNDPPPDLIVEVDITRSAVNRMGIYASLGVPEVWRFRKGHLEFHVLGGDGTFAVDPTSRAFPGIASSDLDRFVAMCGQAENNALIREFREWIRGRAE
jgi:Uma2 family endonuclease